MEQWKEKFKLRNVFYQDTQTMLIIVAGPNTREYNGIDRSKDKKYYIGVLHSEKPCYYSENIEDWYISDIKKTTSYNYHILLKNHGFDVEFYGKIAAPKTDFDVELMKAIISNKQWEQAKIAEINKFQEPLIEFWKELEYEVNIISSS